MLNDKLRTFVMLADLGSYTKAAQQMMVVPSTVSKQIMQLEDELDCELVIRNKKAVKLTPAGEIYLQYAKSALAAEEACLDDIRAVRSLGISLRIGAVVSLMAGHMTAWLNRYLQENSAVKISITTDHSQILLNNLYDGTVDLCFTYRPFHEKNCICMPFVRDEIILATGRGNDAFPDGIRLEELRRLPLVRDYQMIVADRKLYDFLFENGQDPFLSVGSGSYVIPILKAGNGYGFVVRNYIQKELEVGNLTEIRILDHPQIQLQSYVIYRSANPLVTEDLLRSIQLYVQSHSHDPA